MQNNPESVFHDLHLVLSSVIELMNTFDMFLTAIEEGNLSVDEVSNLHLKLSPTIDDVRKAADKIDDYITHLQLARFLESL